MAQMILSVILLCMFIAGLYMLAQLLNIRTSQNARYHIVLCIGLIFYTLGYLMEITAQNTADVVASLRVSNLGIPIIGPFFLLVMLQLCDPKKLHRWMGYAGFAYMLVQFLVVLTNERHHLYYTTYDLTFAGWTQVMLGKGPLYYVFQAISMSCALVAFVVLARRMITWTSNMRRRMGLIIAGCLVTVVGNLINVFNLVGGRLDTTPFAFCITLVLFYIAALRHNLYELSILGVREAVEVMDDAMVILDAEGGYAYHNAAAEALFPTLESITTSVPVASLPDWPENLRGSLTHSEVSLETATARGKMHFRCRINPIASDTGSTIGFSIVMRDVTGMVTMNQKLEELAETDELTRICNRRYFLYSLQQEMERVHRYEQTASVILFDIDHFKRVNDTFGHAAGDLVLQAVTKTVNGMLRQNDVFGRYGGEEFVILCPSTDKAAAGALAERIRCAIAGVHILAEQSDITVKASFGVTQIRAGDVMNDVIKRADEAMYNAKQNGRNQVRMYGS